MKKFFLLSALLLIPFSIWGQAVGTEAPDFDLNSLDDGQIKLSDYRGKVVYIFFFGYNWGSCLAFGSNAETEIHQKYKNQNFQAIGIDVYNGTPALVQTYKQRTTSTFPLCLYGSPVQVSHGVTRDYSEVIDQEGIIRYKGSGIAVSQIQNMIE